MSTLSPVRTTLADYSIPASLANEVLDYTSRPSACISWACMLVKQRWLLYQQYLVTRHLLSGTVSHISEALVQVADRSVLICRWLGPSSLYLPNACLLCDACSTLYCHTLARALCTVFSSKGKCEAFATDGSPAAVC